MLEVNLAITEKQLNAFGFQEISSSCQNATNQPFINQSSVFYLLIDSDGTIGKINFSRARKLLIRKNESESKYDDAIYVGNTTDDSALDPPRLIVSFDNDKCYTCVDCSEHLIDSLILYFNDKSSDTDLFIKRLENLGFTEYPSSISLFCP